VSQQPADSGDLEPRLTAEQITEFLEIAVKLCRALTVELGRMIEEAHRKADPDAYMKAEEVSAIIQLSVRYTRHLMKIGEILSNTVGEGGLRTTRRNVDDYMSRRSTKKPEGSD
jgi:hypothetical protein